MNGRKLAAYVGIGWVPHALGYVALPLLVARRADGKGWRSRIGRRSIVGLPCLAAGVGFIGSALASHYRASPDEPQLVVRPDYLATTGAYAISRNPLYLGGAFMWTGWAVVLASKAVVIAGTALFSFLAFVGVPYEERMLRRRLGPAYVAYTHDVPRWLGRPAHRDR